MIPSLFRGSLAIPEIAWPPSIAHDQPKNALHNETLFKPIRVRVFHLTADRASTRAVDRTLLLLIVRWLWTRRSWNLPEHLERLLCSVFSCIVDVLTVVPIARSYMLTSDVDGTAPRSSAACSTVSHSVAPRNLQVGLLIPLLSDSICQAGVRSPRLRQASMAARQQLCVVMASGQDLLINASCLGDCPAADEVDDGVVFED